jgi:hypothetical protein
MRLQEIILNKFKNLKGEISLKSLKSEKICKYCEQNIEKMKKNFEAHNTNFNKITEDSLLSFFEDYHEAHKEYKEMQTFISNGTMNLYKRKRELSDDIEKLEEKERNLKNTKAELVESIANLKNFTQLN